MANSISYSSSSLKAAGPATQNAGDITLTPIDLPSVEGTLRAWYADLWAARGAREQEIMALLQEIDPFVIRFFQQYPEEDLVARSLYNAR